MVGLEGFEPPTHGLANHRSPFSFDCEQTLLRVRSVYPTQAEKRDVLRGSSCL